MTFLFVGGEDHDFTSVSPVSVNTATTTDRNSTNSRCSLQVGGTATANSGWTAGFSAAASTFWTAAVFRANTASGTALYQFMKWSKSGIPRLSLEPSGAGTLRLQLRKIDSGGTKTGLATTTVDTPTALNRISVFINYAVAGSCKVYYGDTLVLDYSGDLTTNSETSLDSVTFGAINNGAGATVRWSEMIVGTDDPRSLAVITLPLAANGNAWQWSNSYANVDEITTDDLDLATSSTADQLAQATVGSSGVNAAWVVRGVCVSARAIKGGSGSENAQMNVRTGATDYFSSNIALQSAFGRIANIWETNPATSVAWQVSHLTAADFNVGIKSIT